MKHEHDFYSLALDFYVQPIPEPGTFLLVGCGLVGMWIVKTRKRLFKWE
ncbi:PEP-CTERM sorting domain-containing protein [candidate division KSB1 bacterium]|nr:PEP-CTERM sorting domain-containing protein [candidate division KSB1 bacterium]